MEVIRYKQITSTNSKAKSLADRNASEWTVVVSDTQTKGKGRAGRTWKSPKGGLWFSVILRPRTNAEQIPILQFLVANGLREAVDRATGVSTKVKWPNDLVVSGKKLAGILIETKIETRQVAYAVIGIGLNVNLIQKQLPKEATSILAQTGRRFDLAETLDLILASLVKHYQKLWDMDMIMKDWWDHCAHRLRQVRIQTKTGIVIGNCIGVNRDGSIVIRTGRRDQTISDGTLLLAG